jgi:hypothetical protein
MKTERANFLGRCSWIVSLGYLDYEVSGVERGEFLGRS